MLPSFSRIYRRVFKTSRVSGPCPVTNSRPAAIYIYWIGRQKITRLAALCWNIRQLQLWADSGPTDGRNAFFFLSTYPHLIKQDRLIIWHSFFSTLNLKKSTRSGQIAGRESVASSSLIDSGKCVKRRGSAIKVGYAFVDHDYLFRPPLHWPSSFSRPESGNRRKGQRPFGESLALYDVNRIKRLYLYNYILHLL